MQAFEYAVAHSVDEAVALLAEKGEGARPLAGGPASLVPLRSGRRGIGGRVAQTVVADRSGKLRQGALLGDEEGAGEVAVADLRTDAVDALLALQFGRQEADRLVRDALLDRPELDVLEDVLRHVLEQQASHVT